MDMLRLNHIYTIFLLWVLVHVVVTLTLEFLTVSCSEQKEQVYKGSCASARENISMHESIVKFGKEVQNFINFMD